MIRNDTLEKKMKKKNQWNFRSMRENEEVNK